MKYYEKIHQHIIQHLEDRGLDKSLPDLFEKHKILSFKTWRIASLITLFPLSLNLAINSKQIFLAFFGNPPVIGFLEYLAIFLFGTMNFMFPIMIASLLLAQFLPFYKLSQNSFFKKYLGKYFRKCTILASSCDTINYKEEFIMKYVADKEFNLCMSTYYNYLLGFKFSDETRKVLTSRRDKLLDIELDYEQYQKYFFFIVIQFIKDFYRYSKSEIVLKGSYHQEVLDYTNNVLEPSQKENIKDFQEFEDFMKELSPKEQQKQKVKNML